MQMLVRYINGLGEECVEPLYAEFQDKYGKPWVVTNCWREQQPIVIERDATTIFAGDVNQC